MSHGTDGSEELIRYCDTCKRRGPVAIVFCDNCPVTACIHLASNVGSKALCVACLEKGGHPPPLLDSWFRA